MQHPAEKRRGRRKYNISISIAIVGGTREAPEIQ
jgi:hypothetical protein